MKRVDDALEEMNEAVKDIIPTHLNPNAGISHEKLLRVIQTQRVAILLLARDALLARGIDYPFITGLIEEATK